MKKSEDEEVKTFDNFIERWWMMYMLLADLLLELFESIKKMIFGDTPAWKDLDEPRPLDAR